MWVLQETALKVLHKSRPQISTLSHPLSLSFHCRRLRGSQAWFSPSQIHADYSLSHCSYKVWKWLWRLCAPTPSQRLRWADQPAVPQILLLALLDIGFLPVLRNLSWLPGSSKENQESYPNCISQPNEPSCQFLWTCICPTDFNVPTLSPPQWRVNLHCSRLSQWAQGISFMKGNPTSKKQGKEGIEYLDFPCPCL